jgi:hypothetical protein
MRPGRDPFWRAMLAGLGAVGVVPIAALLIALDDSGHSSAAHSEVPARIVHVAHAVDRGDLQTLRSVRGIVRGRLGAVAASLRRCPVQDHAEAWRSCVRWPLARLAIDGRVAGGMLFAVAARDGLGACGDRAMGAANTLRVLGGQADEVVDDLASSSPTGRAETGRAYEATRALMEDLRRQLRRPACTGAFSRGR